jgi:hypothetical protein
MVLREDDFATLKKVDFNIFILIGTTIALNVGSLRSGFSGLFCLGSRTFGVFSLR